MSGTKFSHTHCHSLLYTEPVTLMTFIPRSVAGQIYDDWQTSIKLKLTNFLSKLQSSLGFCCSLSVINKRSWKFSYSRDHHLTSQGSSTLTPKDIPISSMSFKSCATVLTGENLHRPSFIIFHRQLHSDSWLYYRVFPFSSQKRPKPDNFPHHLQKWL